MALQGELLREAGVYQGGSVDRLRAWEQGGLGWLAAQTGGTVTAQRGSHEGTITRGGVEYSNLGYRRANVFRNAANFFFGAPMGIAHALVQFGMGAVLGRALAASSWFQTPARRAAFYSLSTVVGGDSESYFLPGAHFSMMMGTPEILGESGKNKVWERVKREAERQAVEQLHKRLSDDPGLQLPDIPAPGLGWALPALAGSAVWLAGAAVSTVGGWLLGNDDRPDPPPAQEPLTPIAYESGGYVAPFVQALVKKAPGYAWFGLGMIVGRLLSDDDIFA